MSERTAAADPHATDTTVGPHVAPADHGGSHGHDDHGHGGEALEALDARAWGAAALGIALGLAVVAALLVATGRIGGL